MAKMKFSHAFKDLEKGKVIKAGEEVEYTLKRANEIVAKIQKLKGYDGFNYTRTDKK